MAGSNFGLQSGRKMECDLDDLIQHLDIREDEEQGFVLEEDLEELKAEARWTVLAKVNSSKPFSHVAFFANMKYAWSLAKEASFKAIEENLFVIQFSCLGDWDKVMNEGPWVFRGNVVLMEEYDGITKPSMVKFKHLALWVRIYDLPTGSRTKNIGRQLGDKIGKTLNVEVDNEISGWRDYWRVRVKLNNEKPLTRVMYISLGQTGKREVFCVKYEKLPKFCAVCGLLGHVDSECGDGVHDKKAFQYRDWLIASPEKKGDSTNTKRSDSRELAKQLVPKTGTEPGNDESDKRDSIGDDTDLQDDARSPLKRGYDRQPKLDGSGTRKPPVLGEVGDQDIIKLAMALVPVFNKN